MLGIVQYDTHRVVCAEMEFSYQHSHLFVSDRPTHSPLVSWKWPFSTEEACHRRLGCPIGAHMHLLVLLVGKAKGSLMVRILYRWLDDKGIVLLDTHGCTEINFNMEIPYFSVVFNTYFHW